MTTARRSLIDLAFARCLPHWGGEYDIALRYFGNASARSPERERAWLEFQIWKEWYGSGVYGPEGVTVHDVLRASLQSVRMPHGGDGAAFLEDAGAGLRFGADEFAHFTSLFDLWRNTWPDASADIPAWGALPAGRALTALRNSLRDDALGEVAVRLSEGGGLGLFFGILDALPEAREGFDRSLLRVVQRILDDERGHLVHNFAWASQRLTTDDEITRVVALLEQICDVKLREREAQFAIHADASATSLARYRDAWLAPMRDEIFKLIDQGGSR